MLLFYLLIFKTLGMSFISLNKELEEREVGNENSSPSKSRLESVFPKRDAYALIIAIIGGLVGIYVNTGKVGFSDLVGMVIATGIVATLYIGVLSIGSLFRATK